MDRITLNTGATLPRIGLGVYQMAPQQAYDAVRAALAAGYRQIDTAQFYGNEADVGRALRDSGVPRDEVFVTTKLWNEHQRDGAVEPAFEASVEKLGLGPPDLFLLHWPVPQQRLAAWAVLERLYRAGRVKAIGVSNFMVPHLAELLAHAQVVPAVNQIEVSPFLQQREVRALCAKHAIVVQAYSPLTKGQRLGHRVLVRIAQRHARSPAQVLLRWGLQRGVVVLPKSTQAARIAENFDLWGFDLDFADLAALDALEENLVTGWNPQRVA